MFSLLRACTITHLYPHHSHLTSSKEKKNLSTFNYFFGDSLSLIGLLAWILMGSYWSMVNILEDEIITGNNCSSLIQQSLRYKSLCRSYADNHRCCDCTSAKACRSKRKLFTSLLCMLWLLFSNSLFSMIPVLEEIVYWGLTAQKLLQHFGQFWVSGLTITHCKKNLL